MRENKQQKARPTRLVRALCGVAWLIAPVLFSLPTAEAGALSFDIVFECDYGCTTGVDAPIGSLQIDDAILLDPGNTDSFVPIQEIQVTAFGYEWAWPQGPTLGGALPEAYLDASGKPVGLAWTASAAGIGTNFKFLDFDSAPRVWSCEGDCPVLGGAFGSYSIVPVPEPSAALLFGVGILIFSPIFGRSD